MKRILLFAFAAAIAAGISACRTKPDDAKGETRMQSDKPPPPMADVKPQTFNEHGYERIDNFYWLKDKTNPEVIAYLNAENAYADTVMAHTKA